MEHHQLLTPLHVGTFNNFQQHDSVASGKCSSEHVPTFAQGPAKQGAISVYIYIWREINEELPLLLQMRYSNVLIPMVLSPT